MVNYQNIVEFLLMGRKRLTIPTYLEHAPTGQARIVWDGQTVYLGKFGSPESIAKHNQICAEILEHGRLKISGERIKLSDLANRFLEAMDKEYSRSDSKEPKQMRCAARYICEAYPDSYADEISPLKLVRLQESWIEKPLSKATINMYTHYLFRMFGWGVRFELLPETIWNALKSVGTVKERQAIKRTRKGRRVEWDRVEAIKPFIDPVFWDVIQVQWHTGMRAEEVLKMTPGMIDQENWAYVMTEHKTVDYVDERYVFLGPNTRKIIEPYLKGRPVDLPLFSPIEARAARYQRMRAARKSKVQPSQVSRAKAEPQKVPGAQYTSATYGKALRRACKAAGITPWVSHQLRHAKGSGVRKHFGLEGSQVTLGHKSIKTTEIYAEPDMELAKRIAEELG